VVGAVVDKRKTATVHSHVQGGMRILDRLKKIMVPVVLVAQREVVVAAVAFGSDTMFGYAVEH